MAAHPDPSRRPDTPARDATERRPTCKAMKSRSVRASVARVTVRVLDKLCGLRPSHAEWFDFDSAGVSFDGEVVVPVPKSSPMCPEFGEYHIK